MIFGPPSPRVAYSFLTAFHLERRDDSLAFAFREVAVLHTFVSMAGRTQGQSLAGLIDEVGETLCPRAVQYRECLELGLVEGGVSMEFLDKVLKCIDCGADFIFTAGEQLFFHDKQFKNEPKRCKACKTKRVSVLGAIPHTPGQNFAKVETRTVCSQCGKETTVPFRPTQGRPVFCRECFQQRRQAASA